MAAELLVTPSRATDGNQNAYPGAKWRFYATGTSTPQNVYADSDLSTSLGSVVTADSGGKFVPIYLDPSIVYRGKLENADGSVTIYDIDPISSSVTAILADASGASLVGFIQSGVNSVARTVQDKARERLSTADKTGTFLAQLQSAETDINAGGLCFIPRGTHSLSATFTADGQRMNIEGEARNASIISFNPASADVALEYHNTTPGGMYQGAIRKLGFTSSNAVDKTAIRLVNCADTELHEIAIPTGAWLGSGSIGVEVLGRQSLNFAIAEIACARPMVIRRNPVFADLNVDHFKIGGAGVLEMTTTETTGTVIHFDPDVMITTCEMSNLALTGGKYGIYWSESGSAGASYGLAIRNYRREQSSDPTGYSLYLDAGSQTMQTLSISDSYFDQNQNGVYLRKIQRVTIENTVFAMPSTRTAINMDFGPRSFLRLVNCFGATGSSLVLTNAVCVRRENDTGLGFIEEWAYKANGKSGSVASDVAHGGVPFTLAVDAVAEITDNLFCGFIDIHTSEDVSATYHLAQTTTTVTEISDWAGFFTNTKDTPSRVNIYWDAGLSRYMIQNKRASTITVSIGRRGFSL